MTPAAFEALVRRMVTELPDEWQARLGDLAIVVRDEPSPAERRMARVRKGEDLFGLFEGAAMTDRSLTDLPGLPDRVLIFQRPLERAFPDPQVLAGEIRRTLLHELGHYFGLDERKVRKLGYA